MEKVTLLGILLVVLVILLLLNGRDGRGSVQEGDIGEITYQVFYIKSMPCVWAEGIKRGGLSCDWSRRTDE